MTPTASSLQKLLSREDCEKILRRNISGPVHCLAYKVTNFNENVAGFLGEHLSLTITFSSNRAIQKTTYFVKTLPQFNTNQLDYVIESGIFNKEVVLYKNLLTELLKISRFGPKCFLIKDNLIVLEDLKAQGFHMFPKFDYFKEEIIISMLKTLAQFHVSTMVYEKKNGIKLNERFKEEIRETCFSFIEGQPRHKWLISTSKCVTDLFKLLPNKNWNIEEISSKFRKFVFEELETLLLPSKRFRNVLTHDDLWCNNLLFNGKNECIMVDFQLVRYTPPCMDFLTSLYLNLDSFNAENNLHRYGDLYYRFLEEAFKINNLTSDELPKNEFDESLRYYRLAALTEVAFYGTHTFISEKLGDEIVADTNKYNEFSFINRSKFAVTEFQIDEHYRNRLTGILTLLIEALLNKGYKIN